MYSFTDCYAPKIFFSVLAFGFNQQQKSINFIRRHSCQSTLSACYRNPHDHTIQMDALFKKNAQVCEHKWIHSLHSEWMFRRFIETPPKAWKCCAQWELGSNFRITG